MYLETVDCVLGRFIVRLSPCKQKQPKRTITGREEKYEQDEEE